LRSVLITGANRGIGFGCAEEYYQAGWRVFACCRDTAGANGPKQPLGKTDYELWAASMAVNVFGPMTITESFVEHVACS